MAVVVKQKVILAARQFAMILPAAAHAERVQQVEQKVRAGRDDGGSG